MTAFESTPPLLANWQDPSTYQGVKHKPVILVRMFHKNCKECIKRICQELKIRQSKSSRISRKNKTKATILSSHSFGVALPCDQMNKLEIFFKKVGKCLEKLWCCISWGGGVLHQLGEEGYNKIIWFYQMSW